MQQLPLRIALRYLFAKKSQNIINIISMISAIGVMVGTAALLIVLSTFNGLGSFIQSLYGSFDPDLRIEAVEGKVFEADSAMVAQIKAIEGIEATSLTLTDNALAKSRIYQMPAMVMGVDTNYHYATAIDSIIEKGGVTLQHDLKSCIVGYILTDRLKVQPSAFNPYVNIYAPKRTGQISMTMPEKSFVQQKLGVVGAFKVRQSEYDANYIITDLSIARELFCYYGDEVSAIIVRVAEGVDVRKVASRIEEVMGDGYTVLDKWQQHESYFKMMKVEKFMAFLILAFIIAIAAFNIIGSLSMLIFEKKESIFVLKSMGASRSLVTKIFLFEGWLVSVGGVLIGLVLGIVFVLLQQQFGFISFSASESYILETYPMELAATDILLVFVTVVAVGILAAIYPVYSIVGGAFKEKE